jgi:hypothetical protein
VLLDQHSVSKAGDQAMRQAGKQAGGPAAG